MAGKIHALMVRRYAKGRDWYDLLWYRSRQPRVEPSTTLLQAALDQTDGEGTHDAAHWRERVLDVLDDLDIRAIRDDVAPFLERPSDVDLLSRGHLRQVLER